MDIKLSYLYPKLFWGPPGVGKTSKIINYCKIKNLPLVTLIASIHEPVDFSGIPIVVDKRVEYCPPKWTEILSSSKGGVLFLDEINTAPPVVQAALLRVILERIVGEKKLPDNVIIVAAANPPQLAAGGWELTPALANRFVHVKFELNVQEWITNFPSYWNDPPNLPGIDLKKWGEYRSIIASFISRRRDLLLQLPNDPTQYSFPTPRSWDFVSRILTLKEDNYEEEIIGAIGEGAALEFIKWLKSLDLPTPEEILESEKIPNRSDAAYAALSNLCIFIEENPEYENWSKAIKIATKTTPDIAVIIVKRLLKLRKQNWKLPKEISSIRNSLEACKLI